MSYVDMIKRALNGRSVNRAAKDYGVPQKTFERYVKAVSLPDYDLALQLAHDACIDDAEAFKILAAEAATRKGRLEKISEGFNVLLALVKPRGYWVSARC